MRQLPAQNVREDFGIAVRMCWKTGSGCDAIFVENSQTAKVLEFGLVVIGEAECMVGVKPTVVSVPPIAGAAGDDFGVSEGFRHGVFDCRDSAHGVLG